MPKLTAGLDEVGMGSLAGPIVVAVAAFPSKSHKIEGVRDSKKLSWEQLIHLSSVVSERAAWVGYGFASVATINEQGVATAWNNACLMALKGAPDFEQLIVDGIREIEGYIGKQLVEPKADDNYWQCSAASIVAKVMRDNDMIDLHQVYPAYDWASNVGYASPRHREAIQLHGITPLHRLKYVRKILAKAGGPSRF